MRASLPGVLVLACVCAGCAAVRGVEPQAADVRLDIVARALAQVEQRYDTLPPEGSHDARAHLARALADAQESLDSAERAVASWENGDPRPWARVRPCLAANLVRVDAALLALQWSPPPGLTQIIPLGGLEASPCPACEVDRAADAGSDASEDVLVLKK